MCGKINTILRFIDILCLYMYIYFNIYVYIFSDFINIHCIVYNNFSLLINNSSVNKLALNISIEYLKKIKIIYKYFKITKYYILYINSSY